jgi:hypothetical protein
MASHGMAWHRMAWHRMASHRIASHRIAWHRMASHGIAWHRIASHRIASHRIASHRIASQSQRTHLPQDVQHTHRLAAVDVLWSDAAKNRTNALRRGQSQLHNETASTNA